MGNIGFPRGSEVKASASNVGDLGLIPGQGTKIPHAVKVKLLSCVRLFETPWTVAYQASPSMGFFRQEYWSGLPFPSPGDLPNSGMEPGSPALEADALSSEPPGKPLHAVRHGKKLKKKN